MGPIGPMTGFTFSAIDTRAATWEALFQRV